MAQKRADGELSVRNANAPHQVDAARVDRLCQDGLRFEFPLLDQIAQLFDGICLVGLLGRHQLLPRPASVEDFGSVKVDDKRQLPYIGTRGRRRRCSRRRWGGKGYARSAEGWGICEHNRRR